MSDVEVQVTDGAVTVNLGTTGAVSGAASLTTLNALTKVSGTGEIAPSLILVGTIVGAMTFEKTGTTARAITFPDAAITVAGSNYAQSWTADQTLTDINLILSATTGTKIGTAVGQKLGFWAATPIVQPSGAAQAAAAAQTQDTLTDSTGGSASTTLAAATNTSALTDSSGGTANTTIAAITNAANAGSADVGPVADGFADIAAQLAVQRSLNTVLINAVASLAAQLAKVKTDVANVKTLEDAIRTALVNSGIMKGAA